MKYRIAHTTIYRYEAPVQLGTHTLRLRPRSDGTQRLIQFSAEIHPFPEKSSEILDVAGNACLRLWFADATVDQLKIHTVSEVETCRTNPFDYLSEPWAIAAPVDYPSALAAQLAPYLTAAHRATMSPQVVEFAQTLLHEVQGDVGFFLTRLTQAIYDRCQYCHRPQGNPQMAGITLAQQAGSCRDFTVLFMEACRAIGLAARFVSGYQEGDPDQNHRELHAWPEVYVPGGGWRGFDPTHGLAVADQHIALAAAAAPVDAAPVSGQLRFGRLSQSTLDYEITLTRIDP